MRNLLALIATLFIFNSCLTFEMALPKDGTEKFRKSILSPFYHGVASGDPMTDRVIIWTRVTPTSHQEVEVKWEVASDNTFTKIVQKGSTVTDKSKDYTVKLDVTGLEANTSYFYRFSALNSTSTIGKTKTIDNTGQNEIKLGIVSCSNIQWGYFSAYKHLANKKLDAVLHLGDYFYEHGPNGYGDPEFVQKHVPPYEIVELSDYRTRYSQYRLDKDLQLIHQNHPFIAIWDDHEITNNSHKTGAENHQEDEGDYSTRKAVARKAYYEWMPIRDNESKVLYRDFSYGELVDIIVLDERLEGRSEHAESLKDVDEDQTMLGVRQLHWFKNKLASSNAIWKVIGNQVIFSELDLGVVRPTSPKNMDAWDGYAIERDKIIDHISENNIENVVIVTGDTHSSWAFEVPKSVQDYKQTRDAVAIEFGTPSISSANWNERNPDQEVIAAEHIGMDHNPHLKFVNGRDHGYMVLSLTPNKAQADWYYVDNVQDQNSEERHAKSISVEKGKLKLTVEK